jgi:hypothetical protein
MPLDTTRRVFGALDIRLDLLPRWRGGDLGRLSNAAHAAMHEAMARRFQPLPDWVVQPEATFSIFDERGVIDALAWHEARRALLIIELKTELVDINDLMGSMDRRRRLAWSVARERGWDPRAIGLWVAVAVTPTNARHVRQHRTVLRAAFPAGGRTIRSWLREPTVAVAALSLLSYDRERNVGQAVRGVKRVHAPKTSQLKRETTDRRRP